MFLRCSLLVAAVLMASVSIQAHFPEYCAECEQEVWEQVPCSEIPTTQSPPTTSPGTSTTPSTGTTEWPISTTTEHPYIPTTTGIPLPPVPEVPSPYRKCYCECKLGCKEFCRKVVSSDPKQPLTQISSIGEYAPGGQVEISHVHQRKYSPKYGGEGYAGLVGPVGGPKAYKPYKPYPLVYEEQAVPSPAISPAASSPAAANIAAPNFSLEELAQLLSSAYGSKKAYPSIQSPRPRPQSQLQPAPLPSVYYSPVYKQPHQQVVPLMSKVLPAPKRSSKILVSAVASSSGVSLAKIKTPYEEKVVVVTQPPSYDRTTSYPIVEEPKVYLEPQTEAYPIQSQTESYPSQTPNYPSITESYPLHKESYPSITESYPSQTEAYPEPQPQPQVKPYDGSESSPGKPSSTFDLAIDNYLKDFGYGNQGRGYDY
ncbi:hypothetical protein KR009_001805 [Drosophila setifemur]|nr:hypothetical protein KR009_001805 [Drosophila setifemur]